MYYGIPDDPTIMVSDAYSDKEYNDYLKRLYKVYKSLKITDKSTDVEKVYKVTKWEWHNFSYNWDYYNGKADRDSGTCGYSALKKKKATCAGYAEIANDLYYLMDIPSYIIIIKSGNHCWNEIKVDGLWYDFDNTSGDYYSALSNKVFLDDDNSYRISSNEKERKLALRQSLGSNDSQSAALPSAFSKLEYDRCSKRANDSNITDKTINDFYKFVA